MKTKRMYRSENNKILAGICGGLGEYFEIDPTLVRLLFILAAIFGGSGILIYILLWIILPKESTMLETGSEEVVRENVDEIKQRAKKLSKEIKEEFEKEDETTRVEKKKRDSNWLAYLLIATGAIVLMSKFGLIRLDMVWPIILIGLGLLILFR
jgi:phage shock protein C